MVRTKLSVLIICLSAMATAAWAAQRKGLLAEWKFDEGRGNIARDSSGNRRHAKMHGPAWVRQGKGFALSFDGFDDYVDCGASSSLGIGGPVTIEAWVRPTRKAHGEAVLFGESLSTYMMTYYNTEVCGWYIAGGDNSVLGALTLGEWNHVVAAFDGNRLSIWVNGRLKGSRVSKHKKYKPGGHFMIATKGRPDLPKFKGMIDRVRVYNRALSGKEAMAHFKAEAGGYGFDPSGLNRMKTALYYYPERKEVVLEADYKRLLPFRTKGRLEVALSNKEKPDAIIQRKVVDSLPARSGLVDVPLSSGDLPPGSYLVRAVLKDGTERRSVEEVTFTHPRKPSPVPSPAQKVVAPLAQAQKPTPFKFTMAKGGGFQLRVKGKRYSFRSRISWPRGDFNYLSPTGARYRKGEKGWKVRVRTAGRNKYEVLAGGSFYQVHREVEVFPTHVYIKDRYTNATDKDLGLLIYNEAPLKRGQVIESRLSGYDRRGRQAELSYPDYGPSTFFADANTGMGIVPVDDVFVVQAMPYVEWEGAAGVCTEKFALGPGKSYTLEWAVYPTGSKDYYDFINTFRKVENRISTVEAAPGFIGRRSIPDRVAIDRLNMKIAIVPCISHALDDPKLSLEGIEFVDFPKEMQFLKRTNAAIHKKFPDLKVVLHIAHSLYTTNNPDRFADSKVITATGKQASWGDGSDFGKERKAANWKWWIFYPTPGNSFHDACAHGRTRLRRGLHGRVPRRLLWTVELRYPPALGWTLRRDRPRHEDHSAQDELSPPPLATLHDRLCPKDTREGRRRDRQQRCPYADRRQRKIHHLQLRVRFRPPTAPCSERDCAGPGLGPGAQQREGCLPRHAGQTQLGRAVVLLRRAVGKVPRPDRADAGGQAVPDDIRGDSLRPGKRS